jgi:C_GCAxxG_C_C family probable redox protein
MSLQENDVILKMQAKAVGYFCNRPSNFPKGRPYNCCESILLALKDYLDVDSDVIPKIGTAIGAGVSLNGLLCGSVSSVVMAIGLKYGRTSSEENPQPTWDKADKYVSEFKERFGALNCRELTGLNVKTPEGFKEYYAKIHDYACADRIRFAVEKGARILQ